MKSSIIHNSTHPLLLFRSGRYLNRMNAVGKVQIQHAWYGCKRNNWLYLRGELMLNIGNLITWYGLRDLLMRAQSITA